MPTPRPALKPGHIRVEPPSALPARPGLGGSLDTLQPWTPKVQSGESLSQLCDSEPRTDGHVRRKLLR